MDENTFEGLGNRCKALEMAEAGRKCMPGLPLIARMDGRAFHTFCRNLAKPFDENMSRAMIETTRQLVKEFRADIGYTQSDEITLIFRRPETLFDGRFQKYVSVLAGFTSVAFKRNFGESQNNNPHFDARVWQVPGIKDVVDVLLWREDDAAKNSVSMAAQAVFSHKSLQGLGRNEMMDRLHFEANINWNDYPAHFKRGVYLRHETVEKELLEEERAKIPVSARPPEGFKFKRHTVEVLDIQPLRRYSDPVKILFPEAK